MATALTHRGNGRARVIRCGDGAIGYLPDADDGFGSCDVSEEGDSICGLLDGNVTNADSLRGDPGAVDYEKRSASHSKLLTSLYRIHGESVFERLRGGFAAAIWDGDTRRLLLARDQVGHKPLFYCENRDGFFFASEPKALLAAGAVTFGLDLESLTHFLSLRFLPSPHTLVKGISKLAPAHFLVRQDDTVRVREYWSPTFSDKRDMPLEEMIDGLEDKLFETVASWLPRDRRTGSFLSGGLDSGLLVANMARVLDAPFDTFTLGVNDESDEVPLARLVSAKFNTVRHEFYPEQDLVRLLPSILWHTDEPSDMVALTGYLLAGMAQPHVDAVLSGDGGDEMFAGFPRFQGIRDAQYFSSMPASVRDKVITPIARRFGGRLGTKGIAGKILWLTEIAQTRSLAEQYAAAVGFLRFNHDRKRELLTDDAWRQVSHIYTKQLLIDKVSGSDAQDPVERLLHAELLTRLPEQLLMLNDRAGAAHGIDILCPLADQDFVEYVSTIPVRMKIHGRRAKYIQRKLAQRFLPDKVTNSRKTGWSYPFNELCAGALLPFLQSVFADSLLVADEILRYDSIDCLVREHASHIADHHVRIWMLLNLEIWYRMMKGGLHHEDMAPWMDAHWSAPTQIRRNGP